MRIILLLLLTLSALIAPTHTRCNVKKAKPFFVISLYQFSIDLMRRLAQEKENHFVSSTLSTWTLLACSSFGAVDKTLAEFKQVLGLSGQDCFNDKYLKISNTIAVNNDNDVVLERSSAIFVDNNMPLLPKFKKRVKKSLSTIIESLSFGNANAAAQRINDHVSHQTHKVIDAIVNPDDLEDVVLIMIDAIFFKGTWQKPFPFENTQVIPFYNERGAVVGDVKSMFVSGTFNCTRIDQLQAMVAEIPYGSGERYSMLVFLPWSNATVAAVIDGLKLINLKTIQKAFEQYTSDSVDIQLPRFKITSDFNNLKDILENMGLKTMFDSKNAQFSNLSDHPLYVSNIIQKADIEVTEEGTTAAAVTEAEFSFRSYPTQFYANKPFVFMIVDKKFDVPIFVGAYSKPSIF